MTEETALTTADKVDEPTFVRVPLEHLIAAETVSTKEETRHYIAGVHIHAVDGFLRVVSTDGIRLFVANLTPDPKAELPSWLDKGVTISNEMLKPRLSLLSKVGDRSVDIGFAANSGRVVVQGVQDRFELPVQSGEFPQYERIIADVNFTTEDAEFTAVGMNSKLLRSVTDVAKALEATLPKELKSKDGPTIRYYQQADAGSPILFDFPSVPNALLLVMPMRVKPDLTESVKTLAAPAIKGTVGALRAHRTRIAQQLEDAKGDDAAELKEKLKAYDARIKMALNQASALPALPPSSEAPKDAPKAAKEAPKDAPKAAKEAPKDAPKAAKEAAAQQAA